MLTPKKPHKIKVTLEFELYDDIQSTVLEYGLGLGKWRHPEEAQEMGELERFMPVYELRESIEKAIDNAIADDDFPVCIKSMEVEKIEFIEEKQLKESLPNIICKCGNNSTSGECYHCMRCRIDDDTHPVYV